MVADRRNRFLVAAVLAVPVLLWSPTGPAVLGFTVSAPDCATTCSRSF